MQRVAPRNPTAPGTGSDEANHLGQLESTVSCLWILTPLAATISLIVVLVSIFTNQWLHTEEKMSNPSYNGTGEKDYLSKITTSGLWSLCFTNPGDTSFECNRIDYFSNEEYSPDPNDSTMAIPYAVTKSAVFFALATFMLCGSYCFCIIGHCGKHRGLCTFISGVTFIITGLSMLIGLIMYISVFKAEIGGKLRPRSQLQPPAFTYRYGYSFALYVVGFVGSQVTGISALFLFIYRMQASYRRKRLEDVRRGKFPSHTSINYVHVDAASLYCRRHPNAYVNSNSIHIPTNYPSPVHRRNYFYSKEPLTESPCSLHRNHSSSNSLKDVTGFYNFPPPPTISYQFDEPFNVPDPSYKHFPRDVTTNTVSTTADIATCDDDFLQDNFDDYSPSTQHEHEFVTFDLDRPLPLRAQSSVSINSRNENGGSLRKDYCNPDPLRRTTPV